MEYPIRYGPLIVAATDINTKRNIKTKLSLYSEKYFNNLRKVSPGFRAVSILLDRGPALALRPWLDKLMDLTPITKLGIENILVDWTGFH